MMSIRSNVETILLCQLKEEQVEGLEACSRGDTMCVLPTGFGKTLIIKGLPYIHADNPSCILVISPLNCILQQQQDEFGSKAFRVNKEDIMNESELVKKLHGGILYILGHPEVLTGNTMKKILMTHYRNKISHIVIDEAHVILSWGGNDFRPAFLNVNTLRAVLPGAKILALTATATCSSQKCIEKILGMRNTYFLCRSPDRKNIHLCAKMGQSGVDTEVFINTIIDPILYQLKKDGDAFDRTVIYAKLKWCGYIHSRAILHHGLSENSFLIAQYHAPQTTEMKSYIAESMKRKIGGVRLLLATEAYSMGADCTDIHNVLHIGIPSDMETYVQEIGRVGRDGLPSKAILHYNKHDLGNRRHLQNEIVEYVMTKSCRRQYILSYFGFQKSEYSDDCCDNCDISILPYNMQIHPLIANNNLKEFKFKQDQKSKCNFLLQQYFEKSNQLYSNVCIPEMITGLSSHLLGKISQKLDKYVNPTSLKDDFPDINQVHLDNIHQIICQIKQDKN